MGPDVATIQALRGDVALQIARHVGGGEETQAVVARRLDIPQPTLSKIMRGRVDDLSLELLVRVAVRAGLPVVLQTGRVPAEAGAYVSRAVTVEPARTRSRLSQEKRAALSDSARQLTPEQRLEAHLEHSELMVALHRAGQRRNKRLR